MIYISTIKEVFIRERAVRAHSERVKPRALLSPQTPQVRVLWVLTPTRATARGPRPAWLVVRRTGACRAYKTRGKVLNTAVHSLFFADIIVISLVLALIRLGGAEVRRIIPTLVGPRGAVFGVLPDRESKFSL